VEILKFFIFFLSHNVYFPYSIHSPSESDFNFRYLGRYFLHPLLSIFVRVLQMPKIALASYVILHLGCVLFIPVLIER
jgi:hypothetical protein